MTSRPGRAAGERRDDVLLQAVGEEGVRRVGRQIVEGQDGDARLAGRRRRRERGHRRSGGGRRRDLASLRRGRRGRTCCMLARRPHEDHEEPRGNKHKQCDDGELGTAYMLLAAVAVIPGQRHRHGKSESEERDDNARHDFRPIERMARELRAVGKAQGEREIGDAPLHHLALFRARPEHGERCDQRVRGGLCRRSLRCLRLRASQFRQVCHCWPPGRVRPITSSLSNALRRRQITV